MFTGIVEELGEVVDLDRTSDAAVMRVRGPLVTSDAVHGASIAVNGVCLTVVTCTGDVFSVDVMAETLDRSNLGSLEPGSGVNLERAMAASARFGGHIVQGHVDGTGTVVDRRPGERWEVVTISLPEHLRRYVVEKGSITVDGVSLTVSAVGPDTFSVSLIPTTLDVTTLGAAAVGATVNLEVDVLAKYIERLLVAGAGGAAGTVRPVAGSTVVPAGVPATPAETPIVPAPSAAGPVTPSAPTAVAPPSPAGGSTPYGRRDSDGGPSSPGAPA